LFVLPEDFVHLRIFFFSSYRSLLALGARKNLSLTLLHAACCVGRTQAAIYRKNDGEAQDQARAVQVRLVIVIIHIL
jgi:hypothetical protein